MAKGRYRPVFGLLLGAMLVSAAHGQSAPDVTSDPESQARRMQAQLDSKDLELTYRPPAEPGDEVRFALTVRDRITGETLQDPIDVRVVKERPFGGKLPVAAVTARTGRRAGRYEFSLSLPDPGEYEVQVILRGEDRFVTVPFPIRVGGSRSGTMVLGGLTVALLLGSLIVAGHRRGRAVREY